MPVEEKINIETLVAASRCRFPIEVEYTLFSRIRPHDSVGSKKVSAGFMPAGPQLAATQMATELSPLSVRFIREEAMFLNVAVMIGVESCHAKLFIQSHRQQRLRQRFALRIIP